MVNDRAAAKRPHRWHASDLRQLANQVVGEKSRNFATHTKGDNGSNGGRSGGTSSGADRASIPNLAGTRGLESISRRQ